MSDEPRLNGAGGLHDRRTLDRLLLALATVAVLLVAADPLVAKHPYFEVERVTGFYAMVGAATAALAVLVARLLRPLVRRPEGDHVR